ncbi:hypothetical protein HPB51_004470 [Rhipicephalus microplus]|uniref:Potassium channel tetramerisation-type BTB domain-containing protein n=1 Tax=Rhipicephalus microplus TaxID=6941 RepID=A0A9J6EM86_RHIMP|nr:hypothetical protein HPB51_004470 [Rhipicephalus microplus]
MLGRLFSEGADGTVWPSAKDRHGAYLVDRSPTYFEPLLNYLRHGQLILDRGVSPRGVLEEAKFYGIESVIPELERISQGVDLSGADLSRLDLRHINFKWANLRKCRLTWANLSYCCLERADLTLANLEGAQLVGAKMMCANMEAAHLRSCNMEDPAGNSANLEGVNLKDADLDGSQMAGVNLRVATLKNANLQNCHLRQAILAGADLEARLSFIIIGTPVHGTAGRLPEARVASQALATPPAPSSFLADVTEGIRSSAHWFSSPSQFPFPDETAFPH